MAYALRAPCECIIDRALALLVILGVIVASLAIAGEAVLPGGEALAIQLEAARVAAIALPSLLDEGPARLRRRAPRAQHLCFCVGSGVPLAAPVFRSSDQRSSRFIHSSKIESLCAGL